MVVLWRKGKNPEKVLKDYEKIEPLKFALPHHMTDHIYMESSDVLYSQGGGLGKEVDGRSHSGKFCGCNEFNYSRMPANKYLA